MPSCDCQWAGCNGKIISKRLFEDHQRQDRRARVNRALEATDRIIEKQDSDIASHISALTLSDEAMGSPLEHGGRLWARGADIPSISTEHSFSSGPHLPITEALHIIDDIQNKLLPLTSSVEAALRTIGTPIDPNDVFPLLSSLQEASSLQAQLNSIATNGISVREAKRPIAEGLATLVSQLRQAHAAWANMAKLLSRRGRPSFDTSYHFTPILQGLNPIIQAAIFTVVALQTVMHVGRRGSQFLLAMMRYIIQLTLMRKTESLSPSETKLLFDFPTDSESAAQRLHLNGQETIYAVCPNSKCHKTYAPTFKDRSPIPVYPLYCTHRQFLSGPECRTRLTRPRTFGKKDIEIPLKRFVSFSFKDFVAGLMSRPGFEDMMDSSCDSQDGIMRDVADGQFLLKDFKGPDGTSFRSTSENGRYVFSLCIDFFNPFTNKQSGKKVSIGIISVVCLSLPPSQRYKAENMFLVGIIPGPNEPPLTAINHYLTPIIDEFKEFWDPGVHFSRTLNHPEGRLVYCALILVVCDLLAARKAAGFAACTHEHFCSVCHCTRSGEGYGNTDYGSWKRRTDFEYREAASNYLNAENADMRLDEFNKSGVRWSELLRLPYFDISRCVVVDSMHNLFLGLVKEHIKGILGIALPTPKEKVFEVILGSLPNDMSDNDVQGVEKLRIWLEAPASVTFPSAEQALKKLASVNLNSLIFVCQELGCSPASKTKSYKKEYAAKLLEWRLKQPEVREVGSDTSTQHGHVLKEEDMEQIRADLKATLTPSWLASVPLNLGNAAHGKLKADQWRTLGTVHFPLSLTRLWSRHINQIPDSARTLRCHTILLVTMALTSAVILATSRTVTPENAAAYRDYMLSYLEGIKFLFPEYRMRPNHHMAVHIYDYLLLFGPVHSWWTFPFERMIGAVQRMPHNSKLGELEETIARAYTRSANLRAIVTRSGCPDVIRHSGAIFQRLIDPEVRNSLETDIQAFTSLLSEDDLAKSEAAKETLAFSPELQLAFKASQIEAPACGQLIDHIALGGVTYSTSSKHSGNSCALINFSEGTNSVPARIAYIARIEVAGKQETYLAIRRHKPANLPHDPFSSFLVLSAALWDAELCHLEIVRPTQITSHFACLQMVIKGHLFVAALSLSRCHHRSVSEHAALSLQHIRQLKSSRLDPT